MSLEAMMLLQSVFATSKADDIVRQRQFPLAYSLLSVILPAIVILTAMLVLRAVGIEQSYVARVTKSILDYRTSIALDPSLASIAELTGRVRFAAVQMPLVVTAYVGISAAVLTAVRVFRDHGGVEIPIGLFVVGVLAISSALAAFIKLFGSDSIPGIKLRDFFVYLVPSMLEIKFGYPQARELSMQIEHRGLYGASLGIFAAGSMIGAAAILAYRWQIASWCELVIFAGS
jgi:hypothetical protein